MASSDEKINLLSEMDKATNEIEQTNNAEMEKSTRSKEYEEDELTKTDISDSNLPNVCTHSSEVEEIEHECKETQIVETEIKLEKADIEEKEPCEKNIELSHEREKKELEEPVETYEEVEEECIEMTDEYHSKGVVVKAEPIPLMTKKSDIRMFFSHFRLYQDGQILLLPTGNYTSCCYIVFDDESQANAAVEYVRQKAQNNIVVQVRIASEDEYIAALQQTITFSPLAAQLFGSTNSSNVKHDSEQCNSVADTSSVNREEENNNIHDERGIVTGHNSFLIRLRGFPFDATERNIKAFLKDVNDIERIEMASFKDGSFGGEAFIEISNVKGVEKVLTLDKKIMGRRYIEVMPTTVEEKQITINYLQRRNSTVQRLYRANQPTSTNVNNFLSRRGHISSANRNNNIINNISSNTSSNSSSNTWRINDTSTRFDSYNNSSGNYNYYTGNTMTERINFSNNTTVPNTYANTWSQPYPVEQQASLTLAPTGNYTTPFLQWLNYQNNNYRSVYNEGQQSVHNPSRWLPSNSNMSWPQGQMTYNSQSLALTNPNTATYSYPPSMYATNGAYSYVYPSTTANVAGVNPYMYIPAPLPLPRITNEYSEYIIRVRGLPFTATENMIAAHFYYLPIYRNGIHIVENQEKRPNGEAFIELASNEYVEIALRHHGEYMGHRYLEIFRSSREQMKEYGLMPSNTLLPEPEENEFTLLEKKIEGQGQEKK